MPNRMDFLKTYMAVNALTNRTIADIIDKSEVTVSQAFKADDFRLSDIDRIFAFYHDRLDLRLTGGKRIADPCRRIRHRTPKPRLAFLENGMAERGYGYLMIADALGTTVPALKYYFNKDDMTISRICDIAAVMDCSIVAEIIHETPLAGYMVGENSPMFSFHMPVRTYYRLK